MDLQLTAATWGCRAMRNSRWEVILAAGFMLAFHTVFGLLNRMDASHATGHFAGIAVLLALFPLMKWRLARMLQIWALAWLLGDLVFRNVFGPAIPIRSDAGTWRGVLGLAYATLLLIIVRFDRASRRVPPQRISIDSA